MSETWYETNLPEHLRLALKQFNEGQSKMNRGEKYLRYDIDYELLQSCINVAQVEQQITDEQASYLRAKYLGIHNENPNITDNIDDFDLGDDR